MSVHELITDPETASVLGAFADRREEAVLLGRELGGAVLVTAAAPVPAGEEGWEALRRLAHGPVGGLLPSAEAPAAEQACHSAGPLLPGDILLLAAPGSDPAAWRALALEWTGPRDACRWADIPFSIER